MPRRTFLLFLCVILIFSQTFAWAEGAKGLSVEGNSLTEGVKTPSVEEDVTAEGIEASSVEGETSQYDFGDRILYGGTAVDVGDSVVTSEGGFLRMDGRVIAKADAKYLNLFGGLLWFVDQNRILTCNLDGSGMTEVLTLDEEITHLYVTDDGLFYLRDGTVFRYFDGVETAVLTRDGIKGFVPNADKSIRWVVQNPEYTPSAQDDDFCGETADEYLTYITDAEGNDALQTADVGTETDEEDEYTGPYVQVGNTTLPMQDHMPGTFFTKNGLECTCHNTSSSFCIESVAGCNCMRYYPTGIKETCEVDLLGAQCFAFARLVFYKCFGFIDHSMNESLYYSCGSLARGAVTANSIKTLMMKARPGAHVRMSRGHSVSILTMDSDFIVVYHANAGGDGVPEQRCVVSTRRYTWEQFATASAAGIDYVNMPYNYPDSKQLDSQKQAGFYRLKANLNLREKTNTQSSSLAVIPNGSIIRITEIDGFWGKTTYYGKEGWVFLEYTVYYSRPEIQPSGGVIVADETGGVLKAVLNRTDVDGFLEYFDKQSLTLSGIDGATLQSTDYVGTGTEVALTINGTEYDRATVCLAGDINKNGVVDVGDYLMAKRAYMATLRLDGLQTAAADVSGDGDVDPVDYLLIKRFFFSGSNTLFESFL